MLNNVFVNKQTGEKVNIIKEDANFYVLSDNISIKKDILTKRYDMMEEIVDPNTFFQSAATSSDPILNMAQQLKNMDTSKINDDPTGGAQVKFIESPVVLSDNSMSGAHMKQQQIEESIILTPEQKRQMLSEWREKMPGANIDSVQNRNWEQIEDEKLLNGDKPIIVEQKVEEPKADPIKMMFKMFKNNYPVKLNVVIEEQIPNPTFIGMVQENVEADAVEYYANLISEKILKDPTKLKEEIYNQLKTIIDEELKN